MAPGHYTPEDEAAGLDTIARTVRQWMEFDRTQRDREGLPTDSDTAIMAPTHWPTHGQLDAWARLLESLRDQKAGESKADEHQGRGPHGSRASELVVAAPMVPRWA